MATAFASSLQIKFATQCYPRRVCLLSTPFQKFSVIAVVEGPKQRTAERPRIGPKVPPLGVPPERVEFNPPLARELDFLLNHPIAEMIVTGLVVVRYVGLVYVHLNH